VDGVVGAAAFPLARLLPMKLPAGVGSLLAGWSPEPLLLAGFMASRLALFIYFNDFYFLFHKYLYFCARRDWFMAHAVLCAPAPRWQRESYVQVGGYW
jgi:hypothetical protein